MNYSTTYPGFGFFNEEPSSREKQRIEKEKAAYQQNLFLYNTSLVDKSESSYQYRQVVQPFQLIVESDPSDFKDGLGKGIKKAADKMANAVSNYLIAQIKTKGGWPIDTFAGVGGKMNYGITLYLLTDGEMMQLEEALHSGLEAPE